MIESLQSQIGLSPAAKPTKDDPAKIKEAASQFEALLVAQMLRTVRESDSSSWLGGGEDQAGEQAMGIAEEYLATSLSKSGGLGLSNLIAKGLQPKP